MSDMEIHIGKMRKVTNIADVEEWAKQYCLSHTDYTEIPSYYDSWIDIVRSNECNIEGKKYQIFDNEVYEILEHKDLDLSDDIDIFIVDQATGIISFVNMFYNGGTCFEEVMEDNIRSQKSQLEFTK